MRPNPTFEERAGVYLSVCLSACLCLFGLAPHLLFFFSSMYSILVWRVILRSVWISVSCISFPAAQLTKCPKKKGMMKTGKKKEVKTLKKKVFPLI
jgi:hypothetical protein